MIESNNSEQPSRARRLALKRHNAKRCRFATRHAVVRALANDESVESIRRNLHVSRHTVLAIRAQFTREIKEAREDIKDRIALAYAKKSLNALEIIGQRIAAERSPLKQFKLYDELTERIHALQMPVRRNSYPLSIKLANLRRAQRNELSLPSA